MQLTVLQEGCQCTQKQQHLVAVPGVCQLLNGASLKTGKVMALLLKMQANSWGWHGWGVSNADSSNQPLVGANHPACLALEQFGGAHFFWHSFGAPCLHWRAMQGHIKGHVFGPLPQTSWNQGNNINGPASSPRCVLVTSSGAVYLWVTTAPFLHHPPLAVSASSSFLLSHFPFLVRWSGGGGDKCKWCRKVIKGRGFPFVFPNPTELMLGLWLCSRQNICPHKTVLNSSHCYWNHQHVKTPCY